MTPIERRKPVPLKNRKVSVPWAVSAVALLSVGFGLTAYRLEANFNSDQKQTDEIIATQAQVIQVALDNQYQLCRDRVEARIALGVILTDGNNTDQAQYDIIDSYVQGLPPDLLEDLVSLLSEYQTRIDSAYPPDLQVAIECAEFIPPG